MPTTNGDTIDSDFPVLPQRIDRLQTLNEIGRVMSATLDLPTLYETIYRQIGRVMDATQFFIALREEHDGRIKVPYLREDGTLLLDQEQPVDDSLTGRIIDGGTAVLFRTSEEYEEVVRSFGLTPSIVGEKDSESGIFVPLHTGSRSIGALTVQSPRPHAYVAEDVQMLSVLASQAAVAITNGRLYADSEQNARQMQTLLAIAQDISRSLELATVLDSILDSIREVIPFHSASMLLADKAGTQLEVIGTVGTAAERRAPETKLPSDSGVIGKVFTTGQSLIVQDVRQFEAQVGEYSSGIHANMAVPLQRGGSVIGVLEVERFDAKGFSSSELDVLTLFASQAAIAIENARLFAEQQERVNELQAIQNIVQHLTPLDDVHTIAKLISNELTHLIDYNICGVFAVDPDDQALLPIVFDGADFPLTRINLGEGLTGWVALHGTSALVPVSTADDRVAVIPGSPDRVESLISAPLIYQGRVQGVITLSKLGVAQFDHNSLRLLEIIAAQTAIAFDRARLYTELHTDAATDSLTRLYNRRYLLDRLTEERSRAHRTHHALAAIMMDIDRFKAVNDRYGHDAGDVVLIEIARLLREQVRTEDIVARYGGEEFCLLVPEMPEEEARAMAERLRARIASHELPEEAGVKHVTVSVGIAASHAADTGSEMVTRADLAMYRAKTRGGNIVSVSDSRRHPNPDVTEQSETLDEIG